jgi:glycine cleavage system H protein
MCTTTISSRRHAVSEFLETTVDKFTFKVATDRYYTSEGVWAMPQGSRVRIGLSDFLQQRSGDVAFAEVKPARTAVRLGEEIAVIETIKVNVSLGAPVSGVVIETNPIMVTSPEIINEDPYGAGWLAVLDATDWEADRQGLLNAEAYFSLMKGQAEEEVNKP